MLDTTVTIVGNAITMPEWRRLERSGSLVAHFKVASHPRRYDRANERWVDGEGLRVRVTCWRRLAEGVAGSIKIGDPVIVSGRLYCRDWTTEDGQHRVSYELEAGTVGHDLSRGRAQFERTRTTLATSVVEDAQTDSHVGGEPSEVVSDPDHEQPFRVEEDRYGAGPGSQVGSGDLMDPDDADADGDGDDATADLDDVISGLVGAPPVVEVGGTRRRRGRVPAAT